MSINRTSFHQVTSYKNVNIDEDYLQFLDESVDKAVELFSKNKKRYTPSKEQRQQLSEKRSQWWRNEKNNSKETL